MTGSFNQDLYSRFGLRLELDKVQDGFCKYLKNLLLDTLEPLVSPYLYNDAEKFQEIRREVLEKSCKQMFLDYGDYDNFDYGFEWFVEKEFCDEFDGSFQEYTLRLQILLNIIFGYKSVQYELRQLAKQIDSYFQDYPILGLKLKIYKTKAPQVLPFVSKFFNKQIENILGLLEVKKYKDVLESFEGGLKKFLIAKSKLQHKGIIDDMHSACDEVVKIILQDKNKGFKHIFGKIEYPKFGFNSHQKEIFRNLKDWIDKIKHGNLKNYDRDGVGMIISLTASFLMFVINKHEQKT